MSDLLKGLTQKQQRRIRKMREWKQKDFEKALAGLEEQDPMKRWLLRLEYQLSKIP